MGWHIVLLGLSRDGIALRLLVFSKDLDPIKQGHTVQNVGIRGGKDILTLSCLPPYELPTLKAVA